MYGVLLFIDYSFITGLPKHELFPVYLIGALDLVGLKSKNRYLMLSIMLGADEIGLCCISDVRAF